MPKKLDEFLKDVESAKAKGDAADTELIKKLKTLSPEDFARVPRQVLSMVSNQQYADIVRTIAPDMTLKQPKLISPSPRLKRRIWSWLPRPFVAIVSGFLLGVAILCAIIFTPTVVEWWSYATPLTRETDATTWPRCPRLTRWTDGCVYRVKSGLTWTEAAGYLDMPLSNLIRVNRHIQTDMIPAGATLIVWRDRFKLQEHR
jgi:hypothetical protein